MTKKSKLNQKATATLVEYRTALDIKNSIDKLVSQLKNEFTEIVNNHKLVSDKKNFVFDYDNETFVISQSNRDILNQSEVKKLLTSKKLAIPYKTSTSVSIKNVSGTANNVDNELIKMLKVGNNA
jgi:archaellum component FlaF (FlaF/FlaG flagellin family)